MRHVNDAEKAEGYSTLTAEGEPEVPDAKFDEAGDTADQSASDSADTNASADSAEEVSFDEDI